SVKFCFQIWDNVRKSAYSTEKEGVLVWIEVDVSKCAGECFGDVETVASFIEADKKELTEAMNMSVYSAVARKPRSRRGYFESTLLFVVVCISVMILVALIFVVQQRSSRKRKVVENASSWMPTHRVPISLKATKENNRHHLVAFGSAKRKRFDPSQSTCATKAEKIEPQPSTLHVEAASTTPISSISTSEGINQRGPYGRTALMVLVRNTAKTEEQIVEELAKLHAAGADLNLCDDSANLEASPTIRDNTNSTCLHLAARACAPSMVAALLKEEMRWSAVDALDDDNRTALMLVAMYDMVDTKIAEMLCDAGAQVNCDGDNVCNSCKRMKKMIGN
ncbi:ankyrin repeat protein, partial [Cooperia oncophora]